MAVFCEPNFAKRKANCHCNTGPSLSGAQHHGLGIVRRRLAFKPGIKLFARKPA